MRERVTLWGGELSVGPVPGGGYRVKALLPFGDGAVPGERDEAGAKDVVSPAAAAMAFGLRWSVSCGGLWCPVTRSRAAVPECGRAWPVRPESGWELRLC